MFVANDAVYCQEGAGEEDVEEAEGQEGEEVRVVFVAYAVVHVITMMIKPLNAPATNLAMHR